MYSFKKITTRPSRYNPINFFILIAFIVLSLIPLIWLINNSHYPFIGESDFISPVDINTYLQRKLFVFEPILHGGFNSSFLVAGFIPLGLFFLVFSSFNLSYAMISLLFISLLILIAEVSMYIFMRYFLEKNLEIKSKHNKYLAFFSAIIYAFSPYFASHILPGHFILLLPYSFFPLIILFFDKFIMSSGIQYKSILVLFSIFLLCASAFSNVGSIYALLIVLFLYTVINIFLSNSPIKMITRFIYVVILLVAANIWWLFPYLMNIREAVILNTSTNSITQALNLATKNENIYKIFFGKDDLALLGSFAIFIYLLSFFCISILKIRKTFVVTFLFMTILGIFITKGPHEPFSGLFLWMYDNLPGFQIFRRPVSKFYWVFYFFFISLSFAGLAVINKKNSLKKWIIFAYVPLFLIAVYFVSSFIYMKHPIFFSIPKYYYDAKTYLLKQEVDKVLVIPGFFGDFPYYNNTLNKFHGDDFIKYIWNVPIIVPDPSTSSLGTKQKTKDNLIMSQIRENKEFCIIAKELGISHILVRQDIDLSSHIEDKPSALIKLLSNNKSIEQSKYFGNSREGITLATLRNECREKIVSLESEKGSLEYEFQNPTKILVHVSKLETSSPIILRFNFDHNWNLFIIEKNKQRTNNFSSTSIPNNIYDLIRAEMDILDSNKIISQSTHGQKFGYANSWTLDPEYIRQNFSEKYFKNNSDGSIDFDIILYYSAQKYLYIGILIEAVIILIILAGAIRRVIIKRNIHI